MLPQNDVHTEYIRKKSRYETHSWLGLARPPEADLDGVGICEVAAVVPNPVFPSTGPLGHSPKQPGFSMRNPVAAYYGLAWPSVMDELWLVVMGIFHHVASQSVSYLLSVQCEVLSRVS